eukprot:scaffold9821_cov140-Isochrysis_galbana.AAC.3
MSPYCSSNTHNITINMIYFCHEDQSGEIDQAESTAAVRSRPDMTGAGMSRRFGPRTARGTKTSRRSLYSLAVSVTVPVLASRLVRVRCLRLA